MEHRRTALGFLGLALPAMIGTGMPDALQAKSLQTPAAQKSGLHRAAQHDATVIQNIRFSTEPTHIRLVLDLQKETTFTQSRQGDATAIIELQHARLSETARVRITAKKFPDAVSISQPHAQSVILSVDLGKVGEFSLLPLKHPDRLVLDLYAKKTQEPAGETRVAAQPAVPATVAVAPTPPVDLPAQPAVAAPPTPTPLPSAMPPAPLRSGARKAGAVRLIVIDPGHGGKDPGAIGRHGTEEKAVTLKVGLLLKDLITKHLGTKVLMTRDRDVFVELDDRAKFANSLDADLFVSIHVNSHPNRSTKGLEVYHFGEASDRRALEVAARENGLTVREMGAGLKFILADLLTTKKIADSQELAWSVKQSMVTHLDDHYDVVDHGVKTAPFYVIRFTTMPSILAEIAFVSNPTEERLMTTDAYLERVAHAIFQGVRAYVDPVQTAAR